MSRKPENDVRSRRQFITDVAAVTGGSVLAAVSGTTLAQAEEPTAEPKAKKGYRVTEHVRKYYEKARI
ncbi:MAG TPA: hypothetical protein VLT59_01025 [Steroidobacteraceae bacterium]|nr:hypothetical protein [Steroidobacteraceae bacterium]